LSGHFLEPELRRALGDPELSVTAVHPAGGGCIHTAARLATTKGDVFAKWNSDCAPDTFLREQDGLTALRAAGSGLVVPEVLAASAPQPGRPAFIVMEYLAPAAGRLDVSALGRGLAALHRCGSPTFGFPVASFCGPTPQDNAPAASWVEFYAERRLLALVRLLGSELEAGDRRLCDSLVERLPTLLPRESVPSLIHGDLWSGNVLASARGPALVDPACAHADREMEFGITTLFGGFPARFFDAYEEAWPLAAGWRERNPLYQLYHLLNHWLIFGGGYAAQARALLRRYA
jgi:protein-ribulosamine 3-kinase